MVGIPSATSRSQVWTFGFVAALYLAWIAAWLLELSLARHIGWLTSDAGGFVYWTTMKIVLWVIPATIVIRQSGRQVREVIALDHWRSALLWGGGVGAALGALGLITRALGHQSLFAPQWGWGFVNAILVAPIVEEYAFRGAILGGLSQRYRFIVANSLTALFFLGAHLPGWYFQGRLTMLLVTPMGGALSIFILGWIFGFVSIRSKSLLGSTLTHILNNLFAS